MITKLLSIGRVCKLTRRSPPYIRALAAAGVVDCYVCDTGWRGFPQSAVNQVLEHERKRKNEETGG
jgi:hypothetical protein